MCAEQQREGIEEPDVSRSQPNRAVTLIRNRPVSVRRSARTSKRTHNACARLNSANIRALHDEEQSPSRTIGVQHDTEIEMKKFFIAATAVALMCGTALAQESQGKGGQNNMEKSN